MATRKTSENASVVMAFLGLGSNLGNPVEQIRRAAGELLDRRVLHPPVRRSSLYRTPPWGGVENQPWFVNAVVSGLCPLSPLDLLAAVKSIEQNLGRGETTVRWGPRLIDIDILLYGDEVVESAELTIPHGHLTKRAFALVPLLEIEPDLRDPVSRLPLAQHLAALTAEVHKIEKLPDQF